VANHTMMDRAVNYVRYHGNASMAEGGSFYDVLYCLRNYGIVPTAVYKGIEYGDSLPNTGEVVKLMTSYVDAIAKSNSKKLTPVWKKGFQNMINAYYGEIPEKFVYEGKEYTPKSYEESLGLNLDDYVSLTSFTHHPFYTQMNIEVEDNWRNGLSYNLPLDEFIAVMDSAINKGYTFAWGSDVSETGFTRDGIAVLPDESKGAQITGTDMSRWTGMTSDDKRKELTSKPLPEKAVTQESRQEGFDNWETTDDHGMVIFGIAKDQNGKEYYMVKNSWGKAGKYKGIWYASKAFVAAKTMNIMINKNAIPTEIKAKLHI
jgi:aminopeptidase C